MTIFNLNKKRKPTPKDPTVRNKYRKAMKKVNSEKKLARLRTKSALNSLGRRQRSVPKQNVSWLRV